MRIGDWSSDVCSSDLREDDQGDCGPHRSGEPGAEAARLHPLEELIEDEGAEDAGDDDDAAAAGEGPLLGRPRQHREAGRDQEIQQPHRDDRPNRYPRSEEHTSELQSLMRTSYAVFCLKNKTP